MNSQSSHIFWLLGLSGAGKSTLAEALAVRLRAHRLFPLMLDGDTLRGTVCHGLGFSDEDRAENLRRAAGVAQLGLRSHLPVVAAFITPLEAHRQLIASVVGRANVSFIFVDAPLDVCRERDVKGLYAKAQAGKVLQMTGLSSRFEPPGAPDLTVNTGFESPSDCTERLWGMVSAKLSLKP